MADFLMPSLGADMEAGTLLRWHVKPGDAVRRGDVVATVDTEKAAIDVEIWEGGTIAELLVSEGEHVPVGTPLARVTSAGTTPPPEHPPASVLEPTTEAVEEPTSPPTPAQLPEAPVAPAPPVPAPAESRVRVTPLARVAADEFGVDLRGIQGTGMGGAITRADVERAVHPRTATPPDHADHVELGPQSPPALIEDRAASFRRAIAAAMTRSHREIPHYYLSMDVDLTRVLEWTERENRERTPEARLIPAVLFVKAVALAVHDVPEMNGHWVDGAFRPAQRSNVGFAVAIPGGGLVAPALLQADTKNLSVLMTELRELVRRARAGSLRSSELGEATITVTSLGERGGVGAVFGLINPPQVALVGFGSIAERPRAENGMLAARSQVTVSLSGDHRVSDGHQGALFLAAVDRHLQRPELL